MDLTRFQHDQLNCARPKQKSHCFRGKLIRRRAFLRTLPTYFNIGSHPEISEYHNSVNDGHGPCGGRHAKFRYKNHIED